MNKFLTNWVKRKWIHVLVWTVFIIYETVIVGLIYGVYGNVLTYAIHYFITIAFFYFHSDLVLPWALRYRVHIWWRIPLLIAFDIGIYIILHYFADRFLIATEVISQNGPYPLDRKFIYKNLFRGIYFLLFSTGYYLFKIREKERNEQENLKQVQLRYLIKQEQTDKELAQMRNAYLTAQINPHFLFNTLDFVYHSISLTPQVACEAIIYLSRMMRFAIDSNKQGEFIRLGDELLHTKNLLGLYRLRKQNEFLPVLHYNQDVEGLNFIPLVVLTLAENMVKHGSFENENFSAYINISIEDNEFIIETKNKIQSDNKEGISNQGLANIQKRLYFAYGDTVDFSYGIQETSYFLVKIVIQLDKLQRTA